MPKTKLFTMRLFQLLVISLAHDQKGIYNFLKLKTNIKGINNRNVDISEADRLIEKEIISLTK